MGNTQGTSRTLVAALVVATIALLTVAGTLSGCSDQTQTSSGGAAGAGSRQPNIVIFLIDTLRSDRLGVHGYDRRPTSPRIDALARESVVFEQATAPAPWTLPSVVSLLTSTYPSEHNVIHNGHRLGDSFKPLSTLLKLHGYTNISLLANPFAGPDFGLGRDLDYCTIGAAQFDGPAVAEVLDQHPTTPLFLYIHNTEPHNPEFYAPEHTDGFRDVSAPVRRRMNMSHMQYRDLSRADFGKDQPLGTTDNTAAQDGTLAVVRSMLDEYSELYDAAVQLADRRVASVIDTLTSRGLWDDTLFIVLSDHGEELFEHEGWLHDQSVYQELMHVPLIVRFPRGEFGGRRVRSNVSLVDVLPTIIDYMRKPELSRQMRGRSLMPLVRGEELDEDRGFKILGMRVNRKKYYRPWKESRGDVNLVVRRGSWKGIWNAEIDTFELYDLSVDPREQRDVSVGNPELVSEMLRTAREWYDDSRGLAVEAQQVGDLDDETMQRLNQLGYVGKDDEEPNDDE